MILSQSFYTNVHLFALFFVLLYIYYTSLASLTLVLFLFFPHVFSLSRSLLHAIYFHRDSHCFNFLFYSNVF